MDLPGLSSEGLVDFPVVQEVAHAVHDILEDRRSCGLLPGGKPLRHIHLLPLTRHNRLPLFTKVDPSLNDDVAVERIEFHQERLAAAGFRPDERRTAAAATSPMLARLFCSRARARCSLMLWISVRVAMPVACRISKV